MSPLKDRQCQAGRLFNNAQSLRVAPFPVANLRQILAVSIDVLLMLDEFVLHLLLQIISFYIYLRQAIDDILYKMKPVQFVLYSHVERGCYCALFYISPYMQVLVGSTIGQAVYQPRVAVEGKDDVLVLSEKSIVVRLAQPVRVLALGLKLHQIDDIDHPDLQRGQRRSQD